MWTCGYYATLWISAGGYATVPSGIKHRCHRNCSHMDFATSAKKVSSFCFHRGQQNTHKNTRTHKAISIISLCCSDSTRTCINIQSCPSHLIYKNGNSHLCSTIKQLMTLFYIRKNKDNRRIWRASNRRPSSCYIFHLLTEEAPNVSHLLGKLLGLRKWAQTPSRPLKWLWEISHRFSPSG